MDSGVCRNSRPGLALAADRSFPVTPMRQCDDEYPWLSEFLCEYVDGTMHPSARSAFEECLRGNPALRQHVARLQATRNALCGYGCDVHAPCNLREELHARLLREGLLAELAPAAPLADTADLAGRTRTLWTWAPALLVLLCLASAGVLLLPDGTDDAPAALYDAPVQAPEPTATVPAVTVSLRVPNERPAATRADSLRRAASFSRSGRVGSAAGTPVHFAATSIGFP